MEELVEEAVENGKKVVIFSNWTQMTDAIVDRLHIKGYYPAVITGQVTDAFRQEQVNKFQNNDKCKVIVGTVGAMGTGITLTAGTVEIFMDEPWNRANKEQAEDRCHRVGTKENVTIYTLICKDTIDERINELVERKGKMADALVDGKLNIDKGAMLDFLLS
jgi:SNF2 family DNA or RNA helicase